ncbi:hypothetical protein nbrc107696_16270 [Gordonia spumicola]|uniref:DUF805 domain-containing protein n=1 Tax=Gordonia spumicola TaxID=589161 RepID=A0A7I9V7W4_9ACTN|nr:DUF805 domain-containing protein [Gordonia spumicola]GEE01181.1 hypothetical protein nbrc107696_16270 [Gordonia spumicola]
MSDPGTLVLPWYGIPFQDAVRRVFQKFARFDGRASRGEYWWWALANVVVVVVLEAIAMAGRGGALGFLISIVLPVYGLAVLVPSLAVAVRRLHDAGYSGLMILIGLVPVIGGLVVLVLLCMDSKPEGARFDQRR